MSVFCFELCYGCRKHDGQFNKCIHQLLHCRYERRVFRSVHSSDVRVTIIERIDMWPVVLIKMISFFSPFRLPFNWKTPFGFFIASSSLTAAFFALFLCITPTMVFFSASCWVFITFVEDVTNDLAILNIGGMAQRSCDKMRKRFLKIIHLHSVVKQLSVTNILDPSHQNQLQQIFFISIHRLVDEFNTFYEAIICEIFIWIILTIASSMLGVMSILVE